MSKEGKTGVSANTPKNIMFGAGTIHKGLKYTSNAWNFDDTIVGATSGGSKLSIAPEITNVEVDGALVKTKGLTVKTGETATMEINFIELTKDIIKAATIGADGTIGRTSRLSVRRWKAKTSLPLWTMRCVRPALKRKARTRKALSESTRSSVTRS